MKARKTKVKPSVTRLHAPPPVKRERRAREKVELRFNFQGTSLLGATS
jgi:hypothetical protein